MLVPTCLHFPSPNPPKSLQKPILKGIVFLIDFGIVFFRFLLDLGGQLGAMLATCSLKMGRADLREPIFLLGLCYFSIFGRRTPGIPHRGAPRTRWGTLPGFGCWVMFSLLFGCSLGHLGARADAGWFGGVTRSAQNLEKHSIKIKRSEINTI